MFPQAIIQKSLNKIETKKDAATEEINPGGYAVC